MRFFIVCCLLVVVHSSIISSVMGIITDVDCKEQRRIYEARSKFVEYIKICAKLQSTDMCCPTWGTFNLYNASSAP